MLDHDLLNPLAATAHAGTPRRIRAARRAAIALAALIAGLALAAPSARAEVPLLKVERVEAEPSVFPGLARVRVFVTAVQLRGGLISITGAKDWQLQIGSRIQKRLPYLSGRFAGVGHELAIAFVVEVSQDFADVMPQVRDAAAKLVRALPKSTQITVVAFDSEINGGRRLVSRDKAIAQIDNLEGDGDPIEHVLTDAINRAVKELKRAKPTVEGTPLRKMIIVVSDGKNVDMSPAPYRKVARAAERIDAPIHTIAYAPDDYRYPLLGLGELSKRSRGTFRWVRTDTGFAKSFDQLLAEIQRQYVLTFFVPEGDVQSQQIRVVFKDMVSEPPMRVKVTCGEDTCAADQFCADGQCVTRGAAGGVGVLGWILRIVGGLLGLLIVFVGVSLLIGRLQRQRQARAALADAMARQAAEAGDPAADGPPSHQIVPHGPDGHRIQPQPAPGAPHTGAHAATPHSGAYAAAPHTGAHSAAPHTGAHAAAPGAPHTGSHQISPHPAPGQPSGAHPAQPSPPPSGAYAAHAGHLGATGGITASLLILKGPLTGQRIPLRHGFMIGSAVGCDLQLAGDTFASGHHARFLMDTRGGFTLVDNGSTNGTFINGVRTQQKRLTHGMLITVGATEARFLSQ